MCAGSCRIRSTSSARPAGVNRAFLWMFNEFSGACRLVWNPSTPSLYRYDSVNNLLINHNESASFPLAVSGTVTPIRCRANTTP